MFSIILKISNSKLLRTWNFCFCEQNKAKIRVILDGFREFLTKLCAKNMGFRRIIPKEYRRSVFSFYNMHFCYEQTSPRRIPIRLRFTPSGLVCPFQTFFPIPQKRDCNYFYSPFVFYCNSVGCVAAASLFLTNWFL